MSELFFDMYREAIDEEDPIILYHESMDHNDELLPDDLNDFEYRQHLFETACDLRGQ